MARKTVLYAAGAVLSMGAVLQLFQPDRRNPPEDPAASFEAVAAPPAEVRAVVGRACQDCHSHRTAWPWYSRIAPVSWLVASDVREGRARLNLSEWNRYGGEMAALRLKAMCQEVQRGEMPMWQYRVLHPEARLSTQDAAALCSAASRATP